MIFADKLFNNLDKSIYLLALLPLAIVIGNFFVNSIILIISISYLINLIKTKDFIFLKNKKFQIVIFFFILIIISSIFSDYFFYSIKNSLSYLRFLFFFLALTFWLKKYPKVLEYFIYLYFFICVILMLDISFQNITGTDFFGYEKELSYRSSGFFGDEYISGSFAIKILPLCYFIFLIKKQNFLKYFSILVIFSIIILSGERASLVSFIILFLIFLYFIDWKKKLYVVLIASVILFISFKFFYNHTNQLGRITAGLIKDIGLTHLIYKKTNTSLSETDKENITHDIIKSSHWSAHYYTAYNIWIDNKIFGSGRKTFRLECAQEKYNNRDYKFIDGRCSTHPHHMLLEILSETGIMSFLVFLLILFFNFKTLKKKDTIVSFVTIFILINPFIPSGSFFTTINALYFWFYLSLSENDFFEKKY